MSNLRNILALTLSFLLASFAHAQNVPTVPCSFCGGRGGFITMAGAHTCGFCNGTGRTVDPNYSIQKAGEAGYAAGLAIRKEAERRANNDPLKIAVQGVREWAAGNYSTAYSKLRRASVELNYKDAYFYFGLMNELGVACTANRTYAKQLYQKGDNLGSSNCMLALRRINSSGFLSANETNREKARFGASSVCNTIDNQTYAVQMPSFELNVPESSSYGNHNSSSSSNVSRYIEVIEWAPDVTGYGPGQIKCDKCGGKIMDRHVHIKKRAW